LRRNGMEVGEHVPIVMRRGLQLIVAQLAVLKAGGAYVPIDPELPAQRQAFMMRDCGARRVLASESTPPELADLDVQWLDCDASAESIAGATQALDENPCGPLESRAPACVMYTSGSTGTPKGVLVPHR